MSFVWSDKCETSFLQLKELLTTAPILTLHITGESFIVYGDSSHIGIRLCVDVERSGYSLYISSIMGP